MIDDLSFTALKNPAVDIKIERDMEIISNEINRSLRNVDSIILVGSFGRGEGSVFFDSSGAVFPVNDYDLMIITDEIIGEEAYVDLVRKLHEKVLVQLPRRPLDKDFSISVQFMSKRKLRYLLPDVSTIDLKMGSRVICGEDFRKEIPLTCQDIPASSAIVLLFNKVVGLIDQIDSSFFRGDFDSARGESVIYQCARTYMEMATALLIMTKDYVPTYLGKKEAFCEVYKEKFPELYRKIPDLEKKVAFFSDLKLFSKFSEHDFDPVTLWFSTRRDLLEVFRFCAARFLDLDELPSDWLAMVSIIYQKNSKLFGDFLAKTKIHGIVNFPFSLRFVQMYDNFRFFRKLAYMTRRSYAPVLFSPVSPLTDIYCASLSGLLAVRKKNSVDQRVLDFAIRYLRQAYPCEVEGDIQAVWESFRVACVTAQKLYFLGGKAGL